MHTVKSAEQTLFFQEGDRPSVDFALNFAKANRAIRPFACRLTGGCGNMTAADGVGMRNLERALSGHTTAGPRRIFSGFGIFGGTRMISAHDHKVVLPGITEVFPNIVRDCPNMEMLGIVAGFDYCIRPEEAELADKLILTSDKSHITIVHPEPESVLLLKPLPDNDEVWDDEYKETAMCFRALHELGWGTLNIVYNGGSVTEREILLWAKLGREQPGYWNMLLIKDSGRKASVYASDLEFLQAHPNIHVAENNADAINEKLWELGALVEAPETTEPRAAS